MVTILSGLIYSACFEPIGLWFLAPLALGLFFKKLEKTNFPTLTAFFFALVSNSLILHWSGKYVGFLPWILLSLLQALYFLPVGYIFSRTRNLWFVCAAILLSEEIKSRFPFGGFGWTRIGFSQADAPYLNLASIGGVALLSFVAVVLGIFASKPSLTKLLFTIFICLIPIGLNSIPSNANSVSVAGVQGNTPSVGLQFNERAEAVFNLHLKKTAEINRPVDLIVWPENASDIDPFTTPGILSKIQELSANKDAPLLIGAVLQSQKLISNASILVNSHSVNSVYIKQHLTPFGEYIPMRRVAQIVSPLAKGVSDFSPGDSYIVHNIDGFKIGPIICYEIIDDKLVRLATKQSQAFIVQTNSATFAGTSESAQQLNITRIRAVEHNRDILSVSTVGISAFIDNNGKVLKKSNENTSQIIYGSLRAITGETISDKFQGRVWMALVAFSLLIGFRKRSRAYS